MDYRVFVYDTLTTVVQRVPSQIQTQVRWCAHFKHENKLQLRDKVLSKSFPSREEEHAEDAY